MGNRTDFISDFVRSQLSPLKHSNFGLMILIAALIGVGGGFGAVGFRYLIRFVQRVAYGTWTFSLGATDPIPWYILILLPAIGGLAIYPLVEGVAREAKGHGVPEVMEAVSLRGAVIRTRLVLVKALASAVSIGTGGSVGREGPIVQIGSAFGSAIGQLLRVPAVRMRTLVGCGAAAGIAGTFNAPIAGALFSAEVILGDFGVPQFSPIVISSVVSTVVSRHFLGASPAFIVPSYELASAYELLPYAMLGLIAAIVGVGFSTSLYKAEDFFNGLNVPKITKPVIGGLIIGGIATKYPQVLGVGYEAIDMALAGKIGILLLLSLIGLKLIATCVTLASGGSGGIFAPSLFLGAMTGGFWGSALESYFPTLTGGPGAYAMVGMGAVVAATTHAPLTAMIIIFEMTKDYEIIPPLMAACVISTVLAGRLKATSIYTEKFKRRGVDLFEPFEVNVLKGLPVSKVIKKDPLAIPEETPFSELVDLLVTSPRSEFFVVQNGNRYVGAICVNELRQVLLGREWPDQLIIARDLSDSTRPVLKQTDSLDVAMKLFSQERLNELPVVSASMLVGTVHKDDVLEAYHRELTRRDLAGSFQGALVCATRTKCVDLGDGYIMSEMEAPSHFIGKTLRELDVRSRYGLEVILVRQAKKDEKATAVVASPEYCCAPGDVLLVAGREERVRRAAG